MKAMFYPSSKVEHANKNGRDNPSTNEVFGKKSTQKNPPGRERHKHTLERGDTDGQPTRGLAGVAIITC